MSPCFDFFGLSMCLHSCMLFWALQYKEVNKKQEQVQERAIKMVRGWSTCPAKTRKMGVFSFESSHLQGDLRADCQCHWGGYQEDGSKPSGMVEGQETMDRNWNNDSCIQVDTRKSCFTLRAVRQWKRVDREDMSSLCLEVFKIKLKETSSDLPAETAVNRMIYLTWFALWFVLDVRESTFFWSP